MFCLLFTDVRSPSLENIQSWYSLKKYFTNTVTIKQMNYLRRIVIYLTRLKN